jgi:hypothetical protein
MKALTITQPYATLIAIGAKRIETRGWPTQYRGPLAIHAGAGLGPVGGRRGLHLQCAAPRFFRALQMSMMRVRQSRDGETWPEYDADLLPRGAIVAVGHLVACERTDPECWPGPGVYRFGPVRLTFPIPEPEHSFGDYSPGRFMWLLSGVQRLPEPVPCKGALSLWQLPPDVLAAVSAQLQEAI